MVFDLDAGASICTDSFNTNPTYLGTDPDVSNLELDQDPLTLLPGANPSDVDLDSDSDTESEPESSKLHPAITSPFIGPSHISPLPQNLILNPNEDVNEDVNEDANGPNYVDLPDFVKKLKIKLLSGYKCPNSPPGALPEHMLTSVEELSLKHYVAWVESHGTVKAYSLHAKVLKEATGMEILSLYMIRKLAMELTGLSSQLVDMCPKSCIAYTGKFKDDQFCPYIRDKKCNEPRYNNKGQPRAQMLYTPIAPIIKSLYRNETMAEVMRYRHNLLQEALQRLEPNSPPPKYSDYPDSIHHIENSHLFQRETDTAITISTDGAQLTMKKQSNVWVLIVTILNLPPDMRYKTKNTIIPLIIPGPYSPGDVDSFIYTFYEELARLSVGVWAWDAHVK